MKAFAAVLLLALLACADARSMLKKSTATAVSTATAEDYSVAKANADATAKDGSAARAVSTAKADDWSYANANSNADAKDNSYAGAGAKAIADNLSDAVATGNADADDGSKAVAVGLAYANKWSQSTATANAKADHESNAVAKAIAKSTNDGQATSKADATAKYGGDASATSKATANGGSSHATATAVATGDSSDDDKDYYYGHHGYYYGGDDSDSDHHYYPYYYKPAYYHYPSHYGYYIPHPEVSESTEEETPVHYYDPSLVAYYTHLIYDFGCYEGKHYRCKYDDSCGKCPYGHFCGAVTKNVCKDVSVWVKKCEPKAPESKKCVPVLTPCGTDFCKYNQKCATDYFWCKATWCEPKYHCVDVEAPKKCVWVVVADEYGFEKKVEKCTEYVEEACEAGKDPCPIGYQCSADPCTYVETKVKKCADEAVPVCIPYDVPTYKDLYKPCGPGFCHPGYQCEAFEHKSCVKPVVIVKPVEEPKYIHILPIETTDDSDDELHILPIEDHKCHHGDKDCDYWVIPHPDHKTDAKSTATSTATATAGPEGSYSNVDVSATGSGSASGSADATTENSGAWSKGYANPIDQAKVSTGSKAVGDATAKAEGKATYDNGEGDD